MKHPVDYWLCTFVLLCCVRFTMILCFAKDLFAHDFLCFARAFMNLISEVTDTLTDQIISTQLSCLKSL